MDYWQHEVFRVWAIVSKRCLDGKRHQKRMAARRDEVWVISSKRCSVCNLLSARGVRVVKDSEE